ncbi:F-box protein At1g20360-like [Nicotiana tabacum]|uniref:F-box protein At1g20360-like n=1 Tax=Nicotiana tabacum TaxID=4097 RepID=A0A1S3YLX5_TOBAC|nr:PREDICTED: F-box protein At1g20360-like [Nicotiana tabacum]
MELNDDLVVEIISYLPLKLAVRCKILSKNFNSWISDPKFSQTLLQHQKMSTLLLYSSSDLSSQYFHKMFINPIVTTEYKTTLPVTVKVVASSKGLLLLDFGEVVGFCVFNPLTGAHQLIPYPKPRKDYRTRIGNACLAVDYPTCDQYKLVTVGLLGGKEGYKFQVFSSDGTDGMWHKFQLRIDLSNTFSNFLSCNPVYVNDSVHWLRNDGRVVSFNTKREEAMILDLPEFINHHDPIHGNIKPSFDTFLGIAQGLLTLICLFKKSTVIATYDYVTNNWRVTHTSANFIKGVSRFRHSFGFPIWIDDKQVLFLLDRRYVKEVRHLYEYDSEMNRFKIAAVLDKDDRVILYRLPSFSPTLASVHKTHSVKVDPYHLSAITATLDELKRFITD